MMLYDASCLLAACMLYCRKCVFDCARFLLLSVARKNLSKNHKKCLMTVILLVPTHASKSEGVSKVDEHSAGSLNVAGDGLRPAQRCECLLPKEIFG